MHEARPAASSPASVAAEQAEEESERPAWESHGWDPLRCRRPFAGLQDSRLQDLLIVVPQMPSDEECAICYQPFQPAAVMLPCRDTGCRSFFHSNCIVPWLLQNPSCPLCRSPLKELLAPRTRDRAAAAPSASAPTNHCPLVESLSGLLFELEEESRPWLRYEEHLLVQLQGQSAAAASSPNTSSSRRQLAMAGAASEEAAAAAAAAASPAAATSAPSLGLAAASSTTSGPEAQGPRAVDRDPNPPSLRALLAARAPPRVLQGRQKAPRVPAASTGVSGVWGSPDRLERRPPPTSATAPSSDSGSTRTSQPRQPPTTSEGIVEAAVRAPPRRQNRAARALFGRSGDY